jgi:hypothetical protein
MIDQPGWAFAAIYVDINVTDAASAIKVETSP